MIKEGKPIAWHYLPGAIGIGGCAGFLIGWLAGLSNEKEKEWIPSEVGGAMIGMLIGTALRAIVGTVLVIFSSEEEQIIYPHTPEGLSTLKSYSLYYRNIEKKNE